MNALLKKLSGVANNIGTRWPKSVFLKACACPELFAHYYFAIIFIKNGRQ